MSASRNVLARLGLLAAFLFVSSIAAGAAPPAPPGNCVAPTLAATLPGDMGPPNSQANANCFAWQEFIALNWLADPATCAADKTTPASRFGAPNVTLPVVWETYKEASEVFRANAQPPEPWCTPQALPPRFRSLLGARATATMPRNAFKSLSTYSKEGANPTLHNYGEAGTPDAWLTAQNGNIALYEIRLNRDEFAFLDRNRLYDATAQAGFVQNPGFNLPDGTASFTQYGTTGAIELKASWIELPDPSTWPKFKTSKAWVVYPWNPGQPRLVTVGLTGLHIIHKTKNSPQFVWATFEHVNNAPSTADVQAKKLLPWYTFYNAHCDPATDHYQCARNAQPPGTPASAPYFPTALKDPYQAPIQVVRMNPISANSADNVAGLNRWVWQYLIKPANANSVFLNYQLVDVLWSNDPTPVNAGAQVPLPAGTPQPGPQTRIVANTTMETYFQQTKNCLFCHQNASIASGRQLLGNGPGTHGDRIRKLLARRDKPAAALTATVEYASDYSFLFDDAQVPSSTTEGKKPE